MAMGQGSVNLLLGDHRDVHSDGTPYTDPPANGINLKGVVQFFGGAVSVQVSGVVGAGCTLDLLACVRYPLDGELFQVDGVTPNIPATDWFPLVSGISAVGEVYNQQSLNPCLLAIRVNNSQSSTSLRAIVGTKG